AAMLSDAAPAAILTRSDVPPLAAAATVTAAPITAAPVALLDIDELPAATHRSPAIPPMAAAYSIYTSGSTRAPTGTPNHHEGVINRLLWMQDTFELRTDDVVLQKTPASFDVSVWEFFWPLITGARLVLAASGGHQDPAYLRDLIVEQGVTTVH